MPQTAAALSAFIDQCQLVAGRVIDVDPSGLQQDFDLLLSRLPSRAPPAEHLVARAVLSKMLAGMVSASGVSYDEDLGHGFVLMSSASSAPGDDWRAVFCDVANRYFNLVQRERTWAPIDSKMQQALRFIDSHYADPGISLTRVALEAGVSTWHLARTLKQRTGRGFIGHLRRRRVTAARSLLGNRALSIKEISAAVGNRNARQLTRDFQAVLGCTPKSFRRPTLQMEHQLSCPTSPNSGGIPLLHQIGTRNIRR